jgi:N-acyl homoserine lactone hydrolase
MTAAVGAAKRLWALDGATFTLDSGLLVLGAVGEVTIPVPTYLIEHERGLVLMDTGVVPEAAVDPAGAYGELAEHIGLRFTAEQRVDKQIEALGYRVTDVTHVIVSHAHFDHTGGLYLFPHAKFYIGGADLPYSFWPNPAAAAFFRRPDIEATRAFDWNPLDGDHDLFGDGSITILAMPGHTPGNSSVLVRLPDRTFLLTGDTVHLRSALTDTMPMGSDFNTRDSITSIRRLRQIADSHAAEVWVTHDPEDWKDFSAPRCFE